MTTAVACALYNGEQFLLKQLDSIREQTRKPDQVVLCDDGSTDGTVSIVRDYIVRYQLQDTWILIENEQNLGYARNFFKAMSLCNADLIFLADQDDLWKKDKIEQMASVMEKHPEINLLSCKFEIIDQNDQVLHGMLARPQKDTFSLNPVSNLDLLRGFYWLGMLMCVRRTFLLEILPVARDLKIAHDRVLSHCAADQGGFYDFQYVGAYHRRHGNNTEREEHRVAKLLNLPQKIKEIAILKKLWEDMLETELPIGEKSRRQIQERLSLLEVRDQVLRQRSLTGVLRLYGKDKGAYLRRNSMLCDIWLVCFGKLPD